MALDWLREVIDTEFVRPPRLRPAGGPADGAGAGGPASGGTPGADRLPGRLISQDPFRVAARYARGEVQHALWYREWHRRWRGLQKSDQLHRYLVELSRAQSPKQVYAALTEHAVTIVGGYTCLLFPSQEHTPLRPLPNPALRTDSGRLTLSIPLAGAGLIARDEVLDDEAGPFTSLAPLFSEDRAVSLAHAPFGEGGVILLVERRQERAFAPEDWELLRILATHAAAALARVRLGLLTELLPPVHPMSSLPDEAQLVPVLEHALAIARRGEPVSLLGLRLEGLALVAAEDGPGAADRIRRTTAEVLRELVGTLGIAVHRGDDEFVLVLPRLSRGRAERIAARVDRQLPARVRVRSAAVSAEPAPPAELLQRLDRVLDGAEEGTAASVRR